MLHAFPLSSAAFAPQLESLSRKFRMIAPDLSGFGQSEAKARATQMGDFANDALALLDHLKLERVSMLGVSLGGYVCMALLRKEPTRARSLILCDTHPFADDPDARKAREINAQRTLKEGMGALVEVMLPKLLRPFAPKPLREEVTRVILNNSPPGAAAALRGMAARPDSQEVLAAFRGPALLVVGEEDPFVPLPKAQKIAAAMPSCRLVPISGAGHLANLENPPAFDEAIDQFLSSLPKTSALGRK
jgi:pimeloyl-ACP methyl ester carboxylesterase